MASSIYDLLNFPTDDPILGESVAPLGDSAKTQMKLMPNLISDWQQEDIANGDTSGYFQNPTDTAVNTANSSSNIILGWPTLSGTTTPITNLLAEIHTKATTLVSTTCAAFTYHTNRMSNVVSIGTDITNPHYDTAIGYGKLLMNIVSKTDGIEDNSPLLGSFGSILAANAISANANTYLHYAGIYANTVNVTTTDDGLGGSVTTYSSNISLVNAQALLNSANNVYDMMVKYMNQDKDFFQNTKTVVDRFSSVTGFNKMGQTESSLVMNHIGTDKIKSRLSS